MDLPFHSREDHEHRKERGPHSSQHGISRDSLPVTIILTRLHLAEIAV